jgi:hypothetical protein
MRPQPETSAKRPYQPPKLHVYGNLAEMTLTKSAMKGNLDGGMSTGFRKTSA